MPLRQQTVHSTKSQLVSQFSKPSTKSPVNLFEPRMSIGRCYNGFAVYEKHYSGLYLQLQRKPTPRKESWGWGIMARIVAIAARLCYGLNELINSYRTKTERFYFSFVKLTGIHACQCGKDAGLVAVLLLRCSC